MLSRRSLLGAMAALGGIAGSGGLSALLASCKTAPPSGSRSWPRKNVYDGIEMIELFPQEADADAPLVVAIHGLGDRPDRWVDDWSKFPARAQIALPRGFDAYGQGFSWFRFEDGMTDEQFGAAVGAAEARLWKGIAALAGRRRPIVTGFSQGGILSFALAARHPGEVHHAFPVAGACPGPVLPKNKGRAAPVHAFHGTADRVVEVKWGRETVRAFQEQGNDASLKEYEGVGHTMTAAMRRDLWDGIAAALPKG